MIIARHNRDGFFKYYTSEAAILTLESGSRKWSSPLLFNDPFDNQFDLDFPDPTEEIATAMLEKLFTVLTSPEPIRLDQLGSLTVPAEFIHQIHQNNVNFQYADEEIVELKAAVLEGMRDVRRIAPKANEEIRHVMADTNVFCVSERNDNILMWSHYAENHAGIVVKYLALAEVDSPLRLAEPVRYSREMPRLSYDIMLDSYRGRNEIIETLTLSKSDDWAYEKEWRVVATSCDKTQAYEIIPYAPEEIGEVYLGCRIADDKKAKILEIMRRKYPKAAIFQAERHKKKYELVFREMPAGE